MRDPAQLADSGAAVEASLWNELRANGSSGVRERLIEMHLPFARIMAAKLYARRTLDSVEFPEYLQCATVGLLESVDRYDPHQGASFRTFAAHRITGAVLDGIGSLTEKHEQIAARQRVRAERLQSLNDGAAASAGEDVFESLASVAIGLAIGYMLEGTAMYQPEDAGASESGYQAIELRQLQARVCAMVDTLPEREARIVRLHYLNLIPFERIADSMGLTKGRISQLHKRALQLLRDELRKVKRCDMAW